MIGYVVHILRALWELLMYLVRSYVFRIPVNTSKLAVENST